MPVRLGPKFPKESSWITTGERTRLACYARPVRTLCALAQTNFRICLRLRGSYILNEQNHLAGIDIDHASRKLNLREVVTSQMPAAAKTTS